VRRNCSYSSVVSQQLWNWGVSERLTRSAVSPFLDNYDIWAVGFEYERGRESAQERLNADQGARRCAVIINLTLDSQG
jgi:hypothetical protein